MDIKLEIGMKCEVSRIVTENDTANKFSDKGVNLFASPVMFGMMEDAGLKCVADYLPEGYSTVGTHLESSHDAPTPIGMKVTVEAELIEHKGNKLVFKTVARDEMDVIGRGTHTRYIVDFDKFTAAALKKGK